MAPHVSIGILETSPDELHIAIVDHRARALYTETCTFSMRDYMLALSSPTAAQKCAPLRFVMSHAANVEDVSLCVESFRPYIAATISPTLFLALLSYVGLCSPRLCTLNFPQRGVHRFPLPVPGRPMQRSTLSAYWLRSQTSLPLAACFFEDASIRDAAVCTALIGMRLGAVLYFNSQGIVQSSQDVIRHLRDSKDILSWPEDIRRSLPITTQDGHIISAVDSDTERYVLCTIDSTLMNAEGQIALAYELGVARSGSLELQDAAKFGLVQACLVAKLALYCLSELEEGDDERPPNFVDDAHLVINPLAPIPLWLLSCL